MCHVWIVFALVLALTFLLQKSIRSLLLRQIIKVTRPTLGVQQWSEWVTNMVIKLLTHRTPTQSIPANILTVRRIVCPNNNIIGSLPNVYFVHNSQSILAVDTKTLGGYRISKMVNVMEHQRDGIPLGGVSVGNIIMKTGTNDSYENVAMSSAIFAADETAESRVAANQRTFSEGCNLLEN